LQVFTYFFFFFEPNLNLNNKNQKQAEPDSLFGFKSAILAKQNEKINSASDQKSDFFGIFNSMHQFGSKENANDSYDPFSHRDNDGNNESFFKKPIDDFHFNSNMEDNDLPFSIGVKVQHAFQLLTIRNELNLGLFPRSAHSTQTKI
jgi:hypothetical protein